MYGNENKQYHKESTDCHDRDTLPVLLPSSKMGKPLVQTQTENDIFSWSSNMALSQTNSQYKPMALLVTFLFTSKVSKTRQTHHETFPPLFLKLPKLGHVQHAKTKQAILKTKPGTNSRQAKHHAKRWQHGFRLSHVCNMQR